jgi:membrane-associated protease RseP (regulator of RpoE activity)
MDFYIISVTAFAVFIAIAVWADRKNYKRDSIFLLRRTNRGKEFIVKSGTRLASVWRSIGMLSIAVGLFVCIFSVYMLAENVAKVVITQKPMAGLALLLPSPSATASEGPGFMAVPFWYWIICIGVLALVHEGMHGIMAAADKIRIKSLGVGLLAVIPLAFVEPDEKQVAKKPLLAQLRFFSVGSFANFTVAFSAGIMMPLFVSAFFIPGGVAVKAVYSGYPAAAANVTGIITHVDNYTIRDSAGLLSALREIGPNRTVTIRTTAFFDKDNNSYVVAKVYGNEDFRAMKMSYTLKTTESPDRPGIGFIGVSTVNTFNLKDEFRGPAGAIQFMDGLLVFLFIINFGVGFANLMPIKPLDGGRMLEAILVRFAPKRSAGAVKAIGIFTLLLIVMNFIFGFL